MTLRGSTQCRQEVRRMRRVEEAYLAARAEQLAKETARRDQQPNQSQGRGP